MELSNHVVVTPPMVRLVIEDAAPKALKGNTFIGMMYNASGNRVTNGDYNAFLLNVLPESFRNVFHYVGSISGSAAIVFFDSANEVISSYTAPSGTTDTNLRFTIPAGTVRIGVSFSKLVTPKVSQTFLPTDITSCVENWKELELICSRDGTTGVLTGISMPMMLVPKNDKFELLRNLFQESGLRAKAYLRIYQRDRWDLKKYTLVQTMLFDFSEYSEYAHKIEINMINVELNTYLNSQGATHFDIPVKDLQPNTWGYDRMTLIDSGTWEFPETETDFDEGSNSKWSFPSITIVNTERTPGSPEHDMRSQQQGSGSNGNSNYFFEVAQNLNSELKFIDVQLKTSFKYKVETRVFLSGIVPTAIKGAIYIVATALDGSVRMIGDTVTDEPIIQNDTPAQWYRITFSGETSCNQKISLKPGEKLSIGFVFFGSVPQTNEGSRKITFSETTGIDIQFLSTATTVVPIDVVQPEVLLQKYLDLMTGTPGMYTCQINWREEDFDIVLCAAESIRGYKDAYFHGTPNSMLEWLRIMGYEYEIIDNVMRYYPRDYFFDRSIQARHLTGHDVADLVLTTDTKYAWIAVEIGYEKQDYENTNGRFEINGTFSYDTGLQLPNENVMEWISPYRADSMGIEFLCQERGAESKDTKSDNDIFVVAVKPGTRYYYATYTDVLLYSSRDKSAYRVEMFNAPLNPQNLVKYNESMIGISTDMLRFAGTTSNRVGDISTGGNLYSNMNIDSHLFKPYIYNFASGNIEALPDSTQMNGIISFDWEGKTYQGFIKDIHKYYVADAETTWELWAI